MLLLGFTAACSSSDDKDENGQTAFSISSPQFPDGGMIPREHTCEGRAFPVPGMGNPEFNWTDGPAGTQSYALVAKHLAISDKLPPTDRNYFRGFMWAIWDIPASVHQIPKNLAPAQFPTEIPGSQQWQSFNQFGFFAPCPGFVLTPEQITAGMRQVDDYGFTLYAVSTPKVALPARPMDVGNYTMVLAMHLDANNLGKVQLNAKADGIPTGPPMPPDPATLIFPPGVTTGPDMYPPM
jgi:phosphatidylethanolamine-binding protein (PEBP) family uncharacterized protein